MPAQTAGLLIGAILLGNYVTMQYLAEPLRILAKALGTALGTVIIVVVATLSQRLLLQLVLEPLHLGALYLITLLPLVLAVTGLAGYLMQRAATPLHQPLALSHSALLVVALTYYTNGFTTTRTIFLTVVSAVSCALIIPLFFTLRERSNTDAVPVIWRGAPIDLISAGIVVLAMMGFARLL